MRYLELSLCPTKSSVTWSFPKLKNDRYLELFLHPPGSLRYRASTVLVFVSTLAIVTRLIIVRHQWHVIITKRSFQHTPIKSTRPLKFADVPNKVWSEWLWSKQTKIIVWKIIKTYYNGMTSVTFTFFSQHTFFLWTTNAVYGWIKKKDLELPTLKLRKEVQHMLIIEGYSPVVSCRGRG